MNLKSAFVIVAIMMTAGCAGPVREAGTGESTLRVEFAGQQDDVNDTVRIDVRDPPTFQQYQDDGQEHPGYVTAHDQLVLWAGQTDTKIEVELDDAFGYYLTRIAGIPEDTSAFYWSLKVNGTESMTGMTQVEVVEGTTITWTLTAL